MTEQLLEQPPVTVSINPTVELQLLVEGINSLAKGITENELLVTKHGKISLDMAIKTGGLLVKTQELVTENWKQWVKNTITGFSVETAYRWIKLYNKSVSDVTLFDDCESINQAYQKINKTVEVALDDVGGEIGNSDNNGDVLKKQINMKVNSLLRLLKKYRVNDPEYLELLKPVLDYHNNNPYKEEEPEPPTQEEIDYEPLNTIEKWLQYYVDLIPEGRIKEQWQKKLNEDIGEKTIVDNDFITHECFKNDNQGRNYLLGEKLRNHLIRMKILQKKRFTKKYYQTMWEIAPLCKGGCGLKFRSFSPWGEIDHNNVICEKCRKRLKQEIVKVE